MKKYLIIPLIAVLLLAGCSQSAKSSNAETSGENEIFSKLIKENDLDSYAANIQSEIISDAEQDDKEVITSNGNVEVIREPKISYEKSQVTDNGISVKYEKYFVDNTLFYKVNSGEWNKEVIEEVNNEEMPVFTPDSTISSSDIMSKLESYFEVSETEDAYKASLESNSENIDEIKEHTF